jgi:hypothetical protein
MAMHAVGQALVQQGRAGEGMSLLDEAMAGVIGGEGGDPLTVAQMSCMTMVVCGSCFDLERATQWVQSLERFIDRFGCPFLYAECRTYYGRVLFENGDWGAAEALLTEAITMSRGVSRRRTRLCPGRSPNSGSRRGGSRARSGCCAASKGAKRPLRGRLVASLTEASHRRLRLSCVRGSRRRARTGLMSLR